MSILDQCYQLREANNNLIAAGLFGNNPGLAISGLNYDSSEPVKTHPKTELKPETSLKTGGIGGAPADLATLKMWKNMLDSGASLKPEAIAQLKKAGFHIPEKIIEKNYNNMTLEKDKYGLEKFKKIAPPEFVSSIEWAIKDQEVPESRKGMRAWEAYMNFLKAEKLPCPKFAGAFGF